MGATTFWVTGGLLVDKTARSQQEKRASKAKLKRVEEKVERMPDAHQQLEHEPRVLSSAAENTSVLSSTAENTRTTEQDAIAHAVMGAADMAVDEDGNGCLSFI